jgi:hypothetical protein
MHSENKFFLPHKPGTAAVIDHEITTRRAGAKLLKRVGVVQMDAGRAVARTSSRGARPCAVDAAPPRYPHVREEASCFELLDPRERPRVWAQERGGQGREGAAVRVLGWLVCPPYL